LDHLVTQELEQISERNRIFQRNRIGDGGDQFYMAISWGRVGDSLLWNGQIAVDGVQAQRTAAVGRDDSLRPSEIGTLG
jgi:hypothetical protein